MSDLRLDPRPWDLLVVGDIAELADAPIWYPLAQIFERLLDLPYLCLHTASGGCTVLRDFHGDYPGEVDRLLAVLFQTVPALTGVAFPACGSRRRHLATPEAPYGSADRPILAAIGRAAARGEISPEQTIRLLQRQFGRRRVRRDRLLRTQRRAAPSLCRLCRRPRRRRPDRISRGRGPRRVPPAC